MAEKTIDKDFRYIVRVIHTDLDGHKPIKHALLKIKGVSFMFANMACTLAGVEKSKKTGVLSDDEVQKLDDVLSNPIKFGAPSWMFNRKRDPEDGTDKHLLTSDLRFRHDNDLKMLKKMKCYRGIRHMQNLPVRGQRTKSNFRKSKSKGGAKLGVQRKAGTKKGR